MYSVVILQSQFGDVLTYRPFNIDLRDASASKKLLDMLHIDPRGVREGIALIFFSETVFFEKHPFPHPFLDICSKEPKFYDQSLRPKYSFRICNENRYCSKFWVPLHTVPYVTKFVRGFRKHKVAASSQDHLRPHIIFFAVQVIVIAAKAELAVADQLGDAREIKVTAYGRIKSDY